MAYTTLAGLVSGAQNVFNDYVVSSIMEKSAFFRSGVVIPVQALVPQKGAFTHFPYWNGLSGDDEVLQDDVGLTVNALTTGNQIAAVLGRGKAFGVNDLAELVSGTADPLRELANFVGDYWVRQYDRALIASLAGASAGIDALSAGTIINNISAGVGTLSNITAAASYDTMQLMGEHSADINAVVMHSAVYNYLNKLDTINIDYAVSSSKPIETYLGRQVIVDDRLVPAGGVYSTYFVTPAAVGFADGTPDALAVEFDRNILTGNNEMSTRRRYVLHPQGASFAGAATATQLGYTNAELATAGNWTSAFTDINKFGVRVLKHKINQS